MAPIAKEPDIQNSAAPVAPANATQPKVQPVALEIAVTVNGARTVEGSDKREPFSETTQTVLVFGNGAVIRLNSNVAAGQLLFLTNEKTKKEVVCQVVKSKNYRSVSGYVELEFTEPAVGFWGMRFPSDRVSTVPAAPVKPAAPAVTSSAKTVVPPAPVSIGWPAASTVPVNASPVVVEKISTPVATNASADSASEELRKQAARLQEQLSSMQFEETTKPAQGVGEVAAIAATSAKVLEIAKAELPAAVAEVPPISKTVETVEFSSAPKQKAATSLHDEEVKIPAWLEPLARNAVVTPVPASSTPAPSVTPQDAPSLVALTEVPIDAAHDLDSQVAGESEEFGIKISEPGATESSEPSTPRFNADLFQLSGDSTESTSSGSKKGLWIGAIAATVLFAAGGGWWYTQQSGLASANNSDTSRAVDSTGALSPEPEQKYLASTSTPPTTKAFSAPSPVMAAQPVSVEKEKPSASPATEVQKIPSTRETSKPLAGAASTAGKASEPVGDTHKTSFSKLHLAAPKVKGTKATQGAGENEPGITVESNATSGSMNGGLSASHAGPTAPVPVGGEVKPVQLLSAVQPVYPQMARSQRVSGDVKIDALIDENGRVTGMKVVGGPVLLHQAAMDALRQWKYRPATLDGKAVAMHLVVTIQFRLQ
ncbi:MAG: hypothetical protein NVS9B14_21270 [Candidatus Acidiferrum sp.]